MFVVQDITEGADVDRLRAERDERCERARGVWEGGAVPGPSHAAPLPVPAARGTSA